MYTSMRSSQGMAASYPYPSDKSNTCQDPRSVESTPARNGKTARAIQVASDGMQRYLTNVIPSGIRRSNSRMTLRSNTYA